MDAGNPIPAAATLPRVDVPTEAGTAAVPAELAPDAVASGRVPALEVHDLTVSYHRKPVLWNVDLAAPPGKLVGILAPNGAGQSTLIKAVMGLLPPSSGWVQEFRRPVDRPPGKPA